MQTDHIVAVEIDAQGCLHVSPASQEFPLIHREAMEIVWHAGRRSLGTPPPRQWRYGRWFLQVQAAAAAQGVRLMHDPDTQWINVPVDVKREILEAQRHACADALRAASGAVQPTDQDPS